MSQAMSNVMALLAGAAPSGLGQGKVTADGKQAATASDAFSKLLSMMQLGTSSPSGFRCVRF